VALGARAEPGLDGTRGAADLERLPRSSYAYLLGLYLGDGWIATMPQGTFSLRISLDVRYPGAKLDAFVGPKR